MTEVEIRDELKDQGVVGVNRVTLKKEGKVIPTNTLFLTFGYKYRAVNIRYTFIKITNIKVTDAWENTQRRYNICLLYTSPSPRDRLVSRMPSSA